MVERVPTVQYCYSDAWGWGWGYWSGRKYVLDRFYVHCLVAVVVLVLLDPSRFRRFLELADLVLRDRDVRRRHGYVYTCVPLARYERDFIADYCARRRIPIKMALTAGYILLKNIVRGSTDIPEHEELTQALRELRCIDAMRILLTLIPQSIYRKYFINYTPGLRKYPASRSRSSLEGEE